MYTELVSQSGRQAGCQGPCFALFVSGGMCVIPSEGDDNNSDMTEESKERKRKRITTVGWDNIEY